MDSGNFEGFVSSHKEVFEQTTPPANDQVRWQVMTPEDFALKKTCYHESLHRKRKPNCGIYILCATTSYLNVDISHHIQSY